MMKSWLSAVCACAVLAATLAAPTQDTLVVARDPSSTAADLPTDQQAVTEPAELSTTTTEQPAQLKVLSVEARSTVSMRYARTAVITRVRNPSSRALEHTLTLLLPDTAFISGFAMTLDNKTYTAYVKEKEEAKAVYAQAVAQGIGAAHVSAKARDSNHFSVSVNVEPHSEALFNLTYEELLGRRGGVYNLALNLHPGTVVPTLVVEVKIKENSKITVLRVPELRTGNEIDASETDAQNPTAKIERSADEKEATITFTPDIAEQRRLMDVYAEKSRKPKVQRNYWYRNTDEEDEKSQDGVLGQFVIQYDVERPIGGEVLVNDGYFVHFFAPSTLPPLPKHVVFVLDTSGSMMDRKIQQLREAMASILDELREGDFFNIVEFASWTHVFDLSQNVEDNTNKRPFHSFGFSEQENAVKLSPPSQATAENIARAKSIVSKLDAGGGTNIDQALTTALQLVNKGIDWQVPPTATKQQTSDVTEASTGSPVVDDLEATTAVSKPKEETSDTLRLEPIVIFLTDGDPTVGEIDTKKIVNKISELNYGENKAAIFSLAFGEDADRGFLRKISLRNEGFMRHIYEAADAALQLRNFYAQVSSPLLSNVKFVYPSDQVEGLTKHEFRTFYKGSEAVVAGRLIQPDQELSSEIFGRCGVTDDFINRRFRVVNRVGPKPEQGFLPLERLWAYLTIKQKLDEKDSGVAPANNETESAEKQALKLALKYSFVTPLTSLVVVKPNATSAVDAESVDKLPLDNGLSFTDRFASSSGYGSAMSMSAYQSAPLYRPSSIVLSAPAASAGFAGMPGAPAAQLPVADFFALEESSQDDKIDSLDDAFFLPPALDPVPTGLAFLSTTSAPDVLQPYTLEQFQWLRSYVNSSADEVVLPLNGTTVTLKLSKDPLKVQVDGPCNEAVTGGEGECLYLPRCAAANSITSLEDYAKYSCTKDGFLGVCCPKPKSESAPVAST